MPVLTTAMMILAAGSLALWLAAGLGPVAGPVAGSPDITLGADNANDLSGADPFARSGYADGNLATDWTEDPDLLDETTLSRATSATSATNTLSTAGTAGDRTQSSPALAQGTTLYVNVSRVNVREMPSTESAILCQVTQGDPVTFLGSVLDWSQVLTASGKTGYVRSGFLTTEFVSKPTPTPKPTPRPTLKPTPRPTPKPTPKPTPRPTSKPTTVADDSSYEWLTFVASFYALDEPGQSGSTAIGTTPTPGRTIAVDPSVIPYRTKVYIEGYGYRVAEDCGGSITGNKIDILVANSSDIPSAGHVTVRLRIVK